MTILLVVAGLIAFLLILALFLKKDYSIEREVVINRPRRQVFNYIKILKNQDNYSKWVMMDPDMKKVYKGMDGSVGFVSAWDSTNKNVGKGEQEITGIKEDERLDLAIHFIKPFEGRAKGYMTTTSISDEQTKVKWGFNSSMKYPMNLMLLIMNMEKMIGNDLATGLTNLKNVLEKK